MLSNQLKYHAAFWMLLAMTPGAQGQMNYTAVPRWGQAATIIYDTLFISGGKTDPQHQFTYSSAPNTNDILSLNLSMSFPTSSPPWSYLSGSMDNSTSQGPSVAFHTLTPFTSSELLLFGGDAGFEMIQTNADSAWLLNIKNNLSPAWLPQSPGWASEPMRRIYHAAPSGSGAVYILGGQKADGSQIGFPDPYVFDAVGDNGSPVFVPLSDSTNAPSGLFGHAAHVLPGGLLLVFGGFFSSSSSPIPSPLNTIYILDITSKSPTWSVRNASAGAVPASRRGFASVLLDDGRILIHGGADATLQNVFSDGAILDTTQNPMSWSPVDVLSGTLGARVGHFAEPINGHVLFGFGWAGNAPADVNLVLYDPTSSVFPPTFTPAPSPVSVTTLPISPTAPGGTNPTLGPSAGTTGVWKPGQSSHSPSPTSTSGTNGDDVSSSKKTGIVIGSVFGALAFVALAGVAVYYARRRRNSRAWMGSNANNKHDEGRWKLMPETDPDLWDDVFQDLPTHHIPTVQLAGTGWQTRTQRSRGFLSVGGFMGISGPRRAAQQRRDILADEDAYQYDIDQALDEEEEFGVYGERYSKRPRNRREGTGGSSFSFASLGGISSPWNSFVNVSLTSLRNVGVVLGVTATRAGVAEIDEDQNVSPPKWLEKGELPLQSFVEESMGNKDILGESTATRPRGGQYIANSTSSNPYVDPFADSIYEEEHLTSRDLNNDANSCVLDNRNEARGSTLGGDQDPRIKSTPAPTPLSLVLTRITTTSSEGPNGGASLDSHSAPSSHTLTSDGTSNTSSSNINTPISLRSTSIINAIDPPMRRSNSWWLRFSRTPFLDRHGGQETRRRRNSEGGLLDFRDPNPAPRLRPIEESTTLSLQAGQEGSPEDIKAHPREESSGYAVSTKSSVKTGQTADSELIARLDGRMEVVQRALSLNSRGRSVSPTTTLDGFRERQSSGDPRRSWSGSSSASGDPLVQSPIEGVVDAYAPEISPGSLAKPRSPLRSTTGVVAARVSAYERRLSQDTDLHTSPHTPRTDRGQARHSVAYGFVPKSSLYVANPDARTGST
ncbi:hypothetical protein BU17DRAFT_83451 [Hysterangium stoloniferum]|nr:hypothetical protein BU17DRAFT_83451 [Hysterangium stoloniferum]